MRVSLPLIFAGGLVVSCLSSSSSSAAGVSPEERAVRSWLLGKVLESRPGTDAGKVAVDFEVFKCIDTVTFAEEVYVRRHIQELKMEKELEFRDDYRSRGMRTNARRKDSSIAHCRAVIEGLDSIALSRIAQKDSVVYRDFYVVGTADTGSSVLRFDPIFVCIDSDGQVAASSSNRPDLHKTMGKSIPGYMDMLDALKRRGI